MKRKTTGEDQESRREGDTKVRRQAGQEKEDGMEDGVGKGKKRGT